MGIKDHTRPQDLKRYGAKVLGIELQKPVQEREEVTRGESVFSQYTTDTYVENEVSTRDFIREVWPTKQDAKDYFKALLPFIQWLPFYNRVWLLGDMIAGITVGAVVVPQGMAYAKLAELPVQYGLYSSFVGVMIYWFFATSKDITIGPVAVLSTVTGNVVNAVHLLDPSVPLPQIASALAILSGSFVFTLGIIRLGFIVEFIPLVSIAAYMTGSAINIAAGQVPTLMGITGFSTRDPTYWVIIHTLEGLGRTKIDAAMGLTALFLLYFIRWFCNFMSRRYPRQARVWFFASTLRTVFTILLYTMISWLVNRDRRSTPRFAILSTVPRGFKAMGVPLITRQNVIDIAPYLPGTIIVMLIEHIAISKSFGRVNNYTIVPSQELIAIGITNIFGPFFGAYPATGSFSRTAIKSKAGVRTPIAGLITGIVVLLAIYALPAVFFYIPSASLSAVIIHAVGDLITPPKVVYGFWRVNPIEVVIFFAGIFTTIFSSIENGIYVTIASSGGLLLYRIAKARGDFLGRVRVQTIDSNGDHRNIFVPLESAPGLNPHLPIEQPAPGVFIFRFTQDYLYPNANRYTDLAIDYIKSQTRRTNTFAYARPGDRPWNDPTPAKLGDDEAAKPILRAVIFDMTAVHHIDITSTQILVDVRGQLQRYTSPESLEIHFAGIRNRWSRRALTSVGFGTAQGARPVFTIADASDAQVQGHRKSEADAISTGDAANPEHDIESLPAQGDAIRVAEGARIPILSLATPTFHVDLDEALEAVLVNLGSKPTESVDDDQSKDKLALPESSSTPEK